MNPEPMHDDHDFDRLEQRLRSGIRTEPSEELRSRVQLSLRQEERRERQLWFGALAASLLVAVGIRLALPDQPIPASDAGHTAASTRVLALCAPVPHVVADERAGS